MNRTEITGIGSLILFSLLGLAPVQAQTSLEGRFITGMPVPDEALSRAVATTAPKWFHPGRPMRADPVSDYDGGAAGLTNLTTGDLNNDGHPDIAAAHGYRKAGIYLHTGGRTFAAEQVPSERRWPLAANVGATSIATGDLDQDGNLDVVIPLYWDHYRGHLAQLYRGRGDGTFEIWPVDGYNATRQREGIDDGIIAARGGSQPDVPADRRLQWRRTCGRGAEREHWILVRGHSHSVSQSGLHRVRCESGGVKPAVDGPCQLQ